MSIIVETKTAEEKFMINPISIWDVNVDNVVDNLKLNSSE